MSDVRIARADNGDRTLPVFDALERRMEAVRMKAYDLFSQRGGAPGRALDDWIAAEGAVLGWTSAELTEREEAYDVDVKLPDFLAEEIELTATSEEVIVHAEHTVEKSDKDEDEEWSEARSQEVYRRFRLPTPVSAEQIVAKLKDGVLHVHAPKAGSAESAPVLIAPA
jgi:HSP20 family protein